jgi:preprotein translocase subunit SecF
MTVTVKNHSKICLIVSASIMVVALILSLCGLGINYGIDFAGGLSMQYNMGGAFDKADVEQVLKDMKVGAYTITVQGANNDEINVRIKQVSEDGVQGVQAAFEEGVKAKYPAMTQSGDVSYVGPVAGATLTGQRVLLRASGQRADAAVHRHPLRPITAAWRLSSA